MAITWTKEWMSSDDGTVLSGLDLKNIQDDITSGSSGDATSIWSVPVVQPTAAEDGKVLVYDHATPAFSYVASSAVLLPTGVILLWSGAISAIPTGWTLCDGTAGTPNLTDRFVIHADADAAGTNNVGDTGGVSTHALSVAEMPSHRHGLNWGQETGGGTDYLGSEDGPQAAGATSAPLSVGLTGSGTAHANLQPYLVFNFIIKT